MKLQQERFATGRIYSVTRRAAPFIVCMLCLAGPQLTIAAEGDDRHPILESPFSINIGLYYPDRELDLRVNGTISGINDEIDFDKRRQFTSAGDIFATELSWRYRGRWSFIGQYFKAEDGVSTVLEKEIEWGDVVFNVGGTAAIGTTFSLTRFFFGRQFATNESHEVGIGGGLHWLNIGTFIEGEIRVNGESRSTRQSVSAEAPLPNIGAWYKYSISPRWALQARLDLLSANVGDYDGLMVNSAVGVNFKPFEHFGIGLNYNYFKLDVGIDRSDWRGDIETVYDGIYVYASYYY